MVGYLPKELGQILFPHIYMTRFMQVKAIIEICVPMSNKLRCRVYVKLQHREPEYQKMEQQALIQKLEAARIKVELQKPVAKPCPHCPEDIPHPWNGGWQKAFLANMCEPCYKRYNMCDHDYCIGSCTKHTPSYFDRKTMTYLPR